MMYITTVLSFLLASNSALSLSLSLSPSPSLSHRDELIAAMVKTAQETANLALAEKPVPKDKPGPKPAPPTALRSLKSLSLSLGKPKPSPVQYMVFSNHIDDTTCSERSLIEAHGYLTGECFTGTGGLTGLYWSFTTTTDVDNIHLNYAFYLDPDCATTPVVTDVEDVVNGCDQRGEVGGHHRSKRFFTSSRIPNYRSGVLVNGYETALDCARDDPPRVIDWSFLKNNECDPQIHGAIYGAHTTDETRTCRRGRITATLYDSNDLTCSGSVTATTDVDRSWKCIAGSNSGVGTVYINPRCV